jgi:hypothetical protein
LDRLLAPFHREIDGLDNAVSPRLQASKRLAIGDVATRQTSSTGTQLQERLLLFGVAVADCTDEGGNLAESIEVWAEDAHRVSGREKPTIKVIRPLIAGNLPLPHTHLPIVTIAREKPPQDSRKSLEQSETRPTRECPRTRLKEGWRRRMDASPMSAS